MAPQLLVQEASQESAARALLCGHPGVLLYLPAWCRGSGLGTSLSGEQTRGRGSDQPTQQVNWVPACVFLLSASVCSLNNVATQGSLN